MSTTGVEAASSSSSVVESGPVEAEWSSVDWSWDDWSWDDWSWAAWSATKNSPPPAGAWAGAGVRVRDCARRARVYPAGASSSADCGDPSSSRESCSRTGASSRGSRRRPAASAMSSRADCAVGAESRGESSASREARREARSARIPSVGSTPSSWVLDMSGVSCPRSERHTCVLTAVGRQRPADCCGLGNLQCACPARADARGGLARAASACATGARGLTRRTDRRVRCSARWKRDGPGVDGPALPSSMSQRTCVNTDGAHPGAHSQLRPAHSRRA